MEFKDITSELVTSLATSQFHLDIVREGKEGRGGEGRGEGREDVM